MTMPPHPDDEQPDLISDCLAKQARHADDAEFIPGLWSSISKQLQQDQTQDTICENALSPEFISAYHDCEIENSTDITAFEAQLPQNPDSCKLLSDMREISDVIRQFSSRLIDSCSLDICAGVVGTLRDELPISPEIELVSAALDNNLTKAETQKLEALLQQDSVLSQHQQAFSQISTHIRQYAQRLEDQISLDCWPTVAESLQSKVIPIGAGRKRKTFLPAPALGIGVAAAVGLFVFVNWPHLQPAAPTAPTATGNLLSQLPALPIETGNQALKDRPAPTKAETVQSEPKTETPPEEADTPKTAPKEPVTPPGTVAPTLKPTPSGMAPSGRIPRSIVATAAAATQPQINQINQLELATALSNPVSFGGLGFSGADLMATPASYGRGAAKAAPRIYIRPISEDNSSAGSIASQAQPSKTTSDTATAADPKIPSAEEYMFNSLKEDPHGTDVNVIYGI